MPVLRTRRRKSAISDDHASRFAADAVSKTASIPFVLTVEAVRAGAMPAVGDPAMSPSLAESVPSQFRFWNVTDVDKARATRDALVEAEIFSADDLVVIDDAPYRTITKRYLAVVDEVEVDHASRLDDSMIASAFVGDEITVFDERVEKADLGALCDRWLVLTSDAARASEIAKEAGGTIFSIVTRPGLILVSKTAPRASSLIEVSLGSRIEALAKTAITRARFVKADDVEAPIAEERYVLGIVLEPETPDSQGDIYSAEEVRLAAHKFLENYGQIGRQHEEIITGKVKILESYIAPVDFVIESQTVKAGTWLLGSRFVDDAMWTAVKAGSYTGYSIGGDAVRTPIDA